MQLMNATCFWWRLGWQKKPEIYLPQTAGVH
jgi:hypothetical protein